MERGIPIVSVSLSRYEQSVPESGADRRKDSISPCAMLQCSPKTFDNEGRDFPHEHVSQGDDGARLHSDRHRKANDGQDLRRERLRRSVHCR